MPLSAVRGEEQRAAKQEQRAAKQEPPLARDQPPPIIPFSISALSPHLPPLLSLSFSLSLSSPTSLDPSNRASRPSGGRRPPSPSPTSSAARACSSSTVREEKKKEAINAQEFLRAPAPAIFFKPGKRREARLCLAGLALGFESEPKKRPPFLRESFRFSPASASSVVGGRGVVDRSKSQFRLFLDRRPPRLLAPATPLVASSSPWIDPFR